MNAKRKAAKVNAAAISHRIRMAEAQIPTAPFARQRQLVTEVAKLRRSLVSALNA